MAAHNEKRTLVLTLFTFFTLLCPPLWAATFDVTPSSDSDCTDFECDLQSALNAASSNDDGDVINLAAGTYDASGNAFTWGTDQNFPITLIGSDGAIIDGGNTDRGLLLDTSNVALDTNAHITIKNIAFQNGSPPSGRGGGLLITTHYADITVEHCQFIGNLAADGGGGSTHLPKPER